MRLDLFLYENGYVLSRTEAKRFIEIGAVYLNGKNVNKPSHVVRGDESVFIDKSAKEFVGRGGNKLKGAILGFSITVNDRLCLDVGASSGGFTDCLLKFGARHVIAVDSGSGQLVEELRRDNRVTVFENYNARYMKIDDFHYTPELAVMDVSFISSTYIIPSIYEVLADGGEFVCLIKPQFEVGRKMLGKGGIVKDGKARDLAISKVVDFAVSCGFVYKGIIESPIKGGDGNIEYLAHFIKNKVNV